MSARATEFSRRFIITGLISLVAAPAIVRAGSLMPVKAIPTDAECKAMLDAVVDYWLDRIPQPIHWIMSNNTIYRFSEDKIEAIPMSELFDMPMIRSAPSFGGDNPTAT